MVLLPRFASFLVLACVSFPLTFATPLDVQHQVEERGNHPSVRKDQCSGARSKLNKYSPKEATQFCTQWLSGKKPAHPTVTMYKGTTTVTIPGVKQTNIVTSTVTPLNAITTFTPVITELSTKTITSTVTSTSTLTETKKSTTTVPPNLRRRSMEFDDDEHQLERRTSSIHSAMQAFNRNQVTDACLMYLYGTLERPVKTQTGKKTITKTLAPVTIVKTTTVTKDQLTDTVNADPSTITVPTTALATTTTVQLTTTTTSTTATVTPTVYNVQISSNAKYLVFGGRDTQFTKGNSNYLTAGNDGLPFYLDQDNHLQLAQADMPKVWIHDGQDYMFNMNGILHSADPNGQCCMIGSPLEVGDDPLFYARSQIKCDPSTLACWQDVTYDSALFFCPNYGGNGNGAVAALHPSHPGCGSAIQLTLVPRT